MASIPVGISASAFLYLIPQYILSISNKGTLYFLDNILPVVDLPEPVGPNIRSLLFSPDSNLSKLTDKFLSFA